MTRAFDMRSSARCVSIVSLFAAVGCGDDPTFVYGEYDSHPEPPAIMRDVALIDDDVAFTHPYVPGHRTTMDGRIALRVQGGPPGTDRIVENLSFFLFAPEKLEEPVMTGPAGARMMASTEPFDVPFPPALDANITGHHALCDPTQEFAVPGEQPNPYVCGPSDAHDCYDITIISSTTEGEFGTQLWGTPATIEVSAPKTVDARIVDVQLGTPVQGAFIASTREWTEPAVTNDGRLLTGRQGLLPREWQNPETGETVERTLDLAYSVLPENAAPCDVTGWTTFHPMSHAPYDPEMIGRYGLAAYPFRDGEGNVIADGEDLGGTYPWVDREGANVFMAGVPGRLVEQSEALYPRRCATEGCTSFMEATDWDRGFMVGGLWTHGKFVHLDAMINSIDWAVGVTPAAHFMVELYRQDGSATEVRFGSGRFIDAVRNDGGPYPPGYTHNPNILDSVQNLPNFVPAARPVTPRDVVWLMSTGVATDEIAFDDFLDPNAFIVSNMQASITPLYDADGHSRSVPDHHNGQVRVLDADVAIPALYTLDPEGAEDIHIQNAATSLSWAVPRFGRVTAGTGRVEPVALGGIRGRGLWLSGENEIHYAVEEQPRPIAEHDWYVGLFLDPRANPSETRTLMRFPDGSAVVITGRTSVAYTMQGDVVHTVELPPGDGWRHLAWRIRAGHQHVTLLLDGFPIDGWEAAAPLFRMVPGAFVIGQAAEHTSGLRGFRGWIDELKVFTYAPDPEVACNHAHGTLVQIELGQTEDGDALLTLADDYPDWAHAEIAEAAASDTSGRYVCFHDYSADYAATLANIPSGTRSLREAITFPEGPIRAGVPRPDSSSNPFCLTCHHAEGQGGLSLAALAYDAEVVAELDPRRQPLQPPRRVFGNIPGGWIPPGDGPGSPADALVAPPAGVLVDPWVLPTP